MSRKYFYPDIHEEFLKASLRFFYLTSDCFSPLCISSIFSWKERLYLLYLELPRSHCLWATGTQSSRPTDTSGVSLFTVAHVKSFLPQLSYSVSPLSPPLLPFVMHFKMVYQLMFLAFLAFGTKQLCVFLVDLYTWSTLLAFLFFFSRLFLKD